MFFKVPKRMQQYNLKFEYNEIIYKDDYPLIVAYF